MARHNSNTIIKFANDTTVVGLITDNDETAREEVRDMAVWCQDNNLHQQTIMVQTHQDSCEEGTTKPIAPQESEKIWHGSSDP
jgi:hypothetical protein